MKKLLCAMLLIALTAALASGALAEEAPGWDLKISEITVTVNGETVRLKPTLTARIGWPADYGWFWAEAAVSVGKKTPLTLRVSTEGGPLITADGAKIAARLEAGADIAYGVSALLLDEGITEADWLEALDYAFILDELPENWTRLDDGAARVALDAGDAAVSFRLDWAESERLGAPFGEELGRMKEKPAADLDGAAELLLDALKPGPHEIMADKSVDLLLEAAAGQ